MTAPREVLRSDVTKMMNECAPGHQTRPGKRRYVSSYKGSSYHFPKGGTSRTMEVGHVIKLVSQLKIDVGCASTHFPALTFRS